MITHMLPSHLDRLGYQSLQVTTASCVNGVHTHNISWINSLQQSVCESFSCWVGRLAAVVLAPTDDPVSEPLLSVGGSSAV